MDGPQRNRSWSQANRGQGLLAGIGYSSKDPDISLKCLVLVFEFNLSKAAHYLNCRDVT